MFRGVYSAASGMIAAERRQQMLTNRLANAETPGYKQDEQVLRAFPEMLIERIRDAQVNVQGKPSFSGSTPIGTLYTGVYAQEAIPSFQQGDLQETGHPLHLAIVDQALPENPETEERGTLFFAVQTGEDEVRYTRNGRLMLNAEGTLVTSEGYPVLNEDLEPIQVGQGALQVLEDGTLILHPADEAGGEELGRLWIGYTEQPERLVKEGNGVYRFVPENGADPEAPEGEPQYIGGIAFLNDPAVEGAPGYEIRQGFLERSNVDPTRTMSAMLTMYRLYEANQRVLQSYDRSMELAATQIGRLG